MIQGFTSFSLIFDVEGVNSLVKRKGGPLSVEITINSNLKSSKASDSLGFILFLSRPTIHGRKIQRNADGQDGRASYRTPYVHVMSVLPEG
jgi:hypothetical protein